MYHSGGHYAGDSGVRRNNGLSNWRVPSKCKVL